MLAIVANNQWLIDSSVVKLVEAFNAELAPDEQSKRIDAQQEAVGGRESWNTLKPEGLPLGITWTCDAGYLVLVRSARSPSVRSRLGTAVPSWFGRPISPCSSSSAGLHPSGFAWLNYERAVATLAPLAKPCGCRAPPRAIGSGGVRWIAGTDPCCQPWRISGLILDLVLIDAWARRRDDRE